MYTRHLPFQTDDRTQPTKTKILDPTQPNPTRKSTQAMDNCDISVPHLTVFRSRFTCRLSRCTATLATSVGGR